MVVSDKSYCKCWHSRLGPPQTLSSRVGQGTRLHTDVGEGHGEALGPWTLWSDELGPNLHLSHLLPSCVFWGEMGPLSEPCFLPCEMDKQFLPREDGENTAYRMLGVRLGIL